MNYRIGVIDIGVTGRNLVLNIADKGFFVVGYDADFSKVNLLNQQEHPKAKAVSSLYEFIWLLQKPRIVILLVPAGPSVDAVIQELIHLLEPGDIIIDGANSHFIDTHHRQKQLQNRDIHFLGMGMSEAEVRWGPCFMLGGEEGACQIVEPILKAIVAHVDDQPCIAYLGPDSAGHYVKMVHNGIKYGLMQMIAETYEILKSGLNLNDDEIQQVYQQWNKGILKSFLVEITAQIKDPTINQELLDLQKDLRVVIIESARTAIPVPGLMAALSYYDAYRGSWLPTCLIQAQRDYFGAHTYERIDKPVIFMQSGSL